MMSQWRNSLTWKDTIHFAVDVYGFIICGKKEMSGKQWVEHIRFCYDCSDAKVNYILQEIENHVALIEVTYTKTHVKVF